MADVKLSDDALIRAVARGDDAALALLYDRYGAGVNAVALRIVRQPAAAEEIVQETFVRVWRAAISYEGQGSGFQPWLFRIARNLCFDYLRRERVRPQTEDLMETDANGASTVDGLVDDGADVADAAWASVRRQQVHQALDDLPIAQRRAVELAYFEGLSHREIASHLGEPLGTVKTRLRLGLQKLAAVCAEIGMEA